MDDAKKAIQPGDINLNSGEKFKCPGGLPADVNGLDRLCWWEWEELVTEPVLDHKTMSNFDRLQRLQASSYFGLRPTQIQAGNNFVIRLSLVK